MSDLCIVVPTRGRPGNLRELWAAFRETCTSRTMLLAYADEDDPELSGYHALAEEVQAAGQVPGPEFFLVVGARLRLGPTLNLAAKHWAWSWPRMGFMGDDHRPRTRGWDTRYVEALDELGTGLVYGNDLIQGPNLPTQVAMTSDILLAIGHMVPPGLIHLYADNAWLALGRALDAITYLPDVVIEHCHPIAGRAAWDAGYAEANADARADADRAVFEAWRERNLPVWVEKVQAMLRG